jgi:hypothetical protein
LRGYLLNLTYSSGITYKSNFTTSTSFNYPNLSSGDFYFNVCAVNYAGMKMCANEESSADFTPPTIRAYPNATVMTKLPILHAWTNEPAICKHNSTQFTYTNSTYHESRIQKQDGSYVFQITCTDSSGNSASKALSFTIDSSTDPDNFTFASLKAYENTFTKMRIVLKEGSALINGQDPDEFEFFIDGVSTPISVFGNGDGSYNISFIMPKIGTYTMNLTVGDLRHGSTLTSKEFKFSGLYYDASATPANTKHISYHDSATRIGMASDSDINILGLQKNGRINVSGIKAGDNLFIFNTKRANTFLSSEKNLEADFMEMMNPAFSYVLSSTFYNRIIFDPDFDVKVNSSKLGRGKYSYFLATRKSSSGTKEVIMDEK